MTGRRLYDLWCDSHAQMGESLWDGHNWVRRPKLLAWPELPAAERRHFGRVANRLKGVRR